jgi:hypothetical protein
MASIYARNRVDGRSVQEQRLTCGSYVRQRGGKVRNDTVNIRIIVCKVKSKAISVTGRGGPQGCKMLRIPQCLDNRLTDGGKVVR